MHGATSFKDDWLFLFPRGFDYEVNEKGLLEAITPCQCLPKTENTSLAISGIQFSCPAGWVDQVSEKVIQSWLCVRCSFCHLRHLCMALTEKRGRDLSQWRMSCEPNWWSLQRRKVTDPRFWYLTQMDKSISDLRIPLRFLDTLKFPLHDLDCFLLPASRYPTLLNKENP